MRFAMTARFFGSVKSLGTTVSPIPQGDPRDAAKPKQKIGFVDDESGG
jgi:hypothetical protein